MRPFNNMKILVVSSFLPYPLFSGGHIRLFNLIKELSKRHAITLVCEKREYQTEKDIQEVEKICKQVIVIDRKKQWSFRNITKAGFSVYPFLMVGHAQKSMRSKIEEILVKETFDLIHIETFYVMQNLPKVSIPTVLVEHNIEYLVYQRFAQGSSIAFRPLFLLDVMKMKYWEQKFWKEATRLIAVSNEEKKLMARDDVVVVPNGVDIEKFKVQSSKFKNNKKEKRILFIGDFKWIQNRDAVEWMLKQIWPKINSELRTPASRGEQNLELKLWIVGRSIPDSIKKLTDDRNVLFDENAPMETLEIFKQADILLSPIRVGGGTSFKILEAMASRVPVVTTSLGIEGIDARSGDDVLIADSPEGLANHTIRLLEDEEKYLRLAKNARELIEKKYDWKVIVKQLEQVYESVC